MRKDKGAVVLIYVSRESRELLRQISREFRETLLAAADKAIEREYSHRNMNKPDGN